jgi:hypothetical protein
VAPLRLGRAHPATKGLDAAALPQVELPLRSGPRPSSVVLLERDPKATVLAARRYGVGRVLALAARRSDRGFVAWPELGRLLGQALRSLLAPEGVFEERIAPRLLATPAGDRLDLSGLTGSGGSGGPFALRWRGPEGLPREVGRVVAPAVEPPVPLPALPRGSLAHVEVLDASGTTVAALTYVAGKAAEGRTAEATRAEVAQRLLGLAPPAGVDGRTRRVDLLPWFALAALLLLPLDAWLHRRGGTTRVSPKRDSA